MIQIHRILYKDDLQGRFSDRLRTEYRKEIKLKLKI